MPEMPEVETMVDRMQKYVGKTIYRVIISEQSDRYLPNNEIADLIGQTVGGVFRRGKFMLFMLDRGAMLCHNAMSGYWDSTDEPWTFDYVEGDRTPGDNDIRAQIIVCHPEKPLLTAQTLRFHDTRKFGQLHYLGPDELAVKFSNLGPEADRSTHMYEPSEQMTPATFSAALGKHRRTVKEFLLDQQRIAGVGNIYAAEALWFAGISPLRLSKMLNKNEQLSLFIAVRSVLRQALDRKLNYDGLKIYRRTNCPKCGAPVLKDDIAGRATYHCGVCQR